jgi:hypothetical protein
LEEIISENFNISENNIISAELAKVLRYTLYNESKHNILLALVGKANKDENLSVGWFFAFSKKELISKGLSTIYGPLTHHGSQKK